ncbi:hypothetical protein K2X40_02755 [Candidatus Babeliales bacterium]|nr:hypothetical protein [Candidatus Babeliales bacterium]
MMSNFIHWIIFVQIVSESLPVSSSSHVRIFLLLASLVYGAQAFVQPVPDFLDHLLHGPTVLIVMIFFRHEWMPSAWRMTHVARAYVRGARVRESERALARVLTRLISFLFISSVITGIFFGLFKILLKNNMLLAHDATMLAGLCVTAGVLFSLRSLRDTRLRQGLRRVPQGERGNTQGGGLSLKHGLVQIKKQIHDIFFENKGSHTSPVLPEEPDEAFSEDRRLEGPNIKTYAILGLVQGLALLPGISRFASTYVAARWLGFTNRRAFQVCFLLELPVVIAAFVVFGVGGACMNHGWGLILQPNVMLSVAGATLAGYGALWCAWRLAERRLLWLFSGYLLLPILIVLYFIS